MNQNMSPAAWKVAIIDSLNDAGRFNIVRAIGHNLIVVTSGIDAKVRDVRKGLSEAI